MTTWSLPIPQMVAGQKQRIDDWAQAITLQLFKSVVMRSPVGNPSLWSHPAPPGYVGGRFRANWNVSLNAPNFATTQETSVARAMGEVAKAGTFSAGNVVYLTNGLPYARELEYGHSSQAPQGMVRLALLSVTSGVGQRGK